MFLGSREDIAHLGYVLGQCPKCRAQGVFTVYEAKRKLTLYVVASLPMGQQQILECRACGGRFALPSEMKDDLQQRIISADQLADYVGRIPAGPRATANGNGAAPVRTLYQTLQLDPAAEPEVIEAAFKRLAMKYHPDRYKAADATERMREILSAKEVLTDPAKRRAYDASIGIAYRPKPPDAIRPDEV
ncbi:MAG: DnaJ domain-containing protein [Thermomicrobiales bacterium]